MRIYLDHNAGAPLRPEVKVALEAAIAGTSGNPASVHSHGQAARKKLEWARGCVASLISASPRQLLFTSGGTESNNTAILGAAGTRPGRDRIVSSAIEHSSVLQPLKQLEREERQVELINPDRDGRIDPERVIAALDDRTALVTLGFANSEIGTIQPLDGVADAARRVGAIFHVDAAQAAGRIPVSVNDLDCDLMTISGHKLGAPAGIGALFVRQPDLLTAMIRGGPQEGGLRAGTQNLIGALAFGAAAKVVAENLTTEAEHYRLLTNRLLSALRESIPGVQLNGPERERLPNTINLTFPNVIGESLLIALDLEGVSASMGSACAAGSVEPSHVLIAMGRSEAEARSSLRFSVGFSNTIEELDRAAAIIADVWRRVAESETPSREARL